MQALIDRFFEILLKIFCFFENVGTLVYGVASKIIKSVFGYIFNAIATIFGSLFRWLKKQFRQPLYDAYCYLLTPIAHAWGDLAHANLKFKKAKKLGFRQGIKSFGHFLIRFFVNLFKLFKYSFDYVAPAVCIVFLISLIKYAGTLQYAVSVKYNGTDLGVITDSATYNQAQSLAQDKVTFTDEDDSIIVAPTFSIQRLGENDQTVDADDLSELILSAGDEKIVNAYGFYINDSLLGVYDEAEMLRIKTALENHLLKFYDPKAVSIDFVDDVIISEGRFLESNLVPADWAIELINREVEVEAYYVIERGDSVGLIATKLGLTRDQLIEYNPFLEDGAHTGDLVTYYYNEPYLAVATTHYETYDQVIERQTVYQYTDKAEQYNEVLIQSGSSGFENVTALVTEVNGVESDRVIVSRTILEEMVPRIFEAGTKENTWLEEDELWVIEDLGTLCWPVDGGYVSSLYGYRRWDHSNHKGLDIAAKRGTELYAVADGVVTYAATRGTFGKLVIIDHGDGYQTYYAHQYKIACEKGDKVEKGDLIGYVGMTGSASGNHLHIELRYKNERIDPMLGLAGPGIHDINE